MTDRFVTVGDDLALPPDVKVLDAHLPAASNAAAVGAKLDDAQLGAASGVAPLDTDSKLPEAHIPARLSDTSLNATYAREFEPTEAIVYDPATGYVSSVTEGGITTTYTYNADGTVNTETRLGKVRTWAYDANGNPTSSTVV